MLKQLYQQKTRDYSQKYNNYERENLIDKGKRTLKVLGQTFLQLAERLKDKSIEINYIHNKYQQ